MHEGIDREEMIKVDNQIDWEVVMERAGAMGWSRSEFQDATLREFRAFFRGWQRSKGIDPDAPSVETIGYMDHVEAARLFAEHDAKKQQASRDEEQ